MQQSEFASSPSLTIQWNINGIIHGQGRKPTISEFFCMKCQSLQHLAKPLGSLSATTAF